MKRPVITASVFVVLLYLSTMPVATQRAQARGRGAAAGESERTHAASTCKVEAAKAGPKTPGELLTQNKKLSDKLSTILKEQNPPVTDLEAASQGFQILVVFVSAVHVSDNLGIPFDQLQTQAQDERKP